MRLWVRPMTMTTDHPRARIVAITLGHLADVLLTEWSREYGIPESLSDICQYDTFTKIVAERTLHEAGVDVFWNDLVCSTKEQAAAAVGAVADRGVDLEALYGPNYAAILGVIEGCVLMDSAQVAALGYQMQGGYSTDYATVYELARIAGVEPKLDRVLSDIQYAAHKNTVHSPAGIQRHLMGVRAAELTAAYYVLKGEGVVMNEDFELRLTRPMRAYLFPDEPRL